MVWHFLFFPTLNENVFALKLPSFEHLASAPPRSALTVFRILARSFSAVVNFHRIVKLILIHRSNILYFKSFEKVVIAILNRSNKFFSQLLYVDKKLKGLKENVIIVISSDPSCWNGYPRFTMEQLIPLFNSCLFFCSRNAHITLAEKLQLKWSAFIKINTDIKFILQLLSVLMCINVLMY